MPDEPPSTTKLDEVAARASIPGGRFRKVSQLSQRERDFVVALERADTTDNYLAAHAEFGYSVEEARRICQTYVEEAEYYVNSVKEWLDELRMITGLHDRFRSMGERGIGDCVKYVEESLPELSKALYPRRYAVPGGYAAPRRLVAAAFYAMNDGCEFDADTRELMHLPPNPSPAEHNDQAIKVCAALAEYAVPTYFVTSQLLEDLRETDLPKDFSTADMPWPMDAMLFSLPERMVSCGGEGETLELIAVARCVEGKEYPSNWMHWGKLEHRIVRPAIRHTGPETVAIVGLTSKGRLLQWECPTGPHSIHEASLVKLRGVRLDSLVFEDLPREGNDGAATVLPATTFQIILAMLACPELIERGVVVRPEKVKRGKVAQNALWSPNFFGRSYRKAVELGGTSEGHRKRMHWRRAHFRHLRGPDGNVTRVLWIARMLINKPDTDGQASIPTQPATP